MLIAFSGNAFAAEEEDTNCSRVKAYLAKLDEAKSWRSLQEHFGMRKGSEEMIQLEDKSYLRWNGGPWHVHKRFVVQTRHGDVDLVRDCRIVQLDPAVEPLALLRYQRYYSGQVISFQAWIDRDTGLPVKTTGSRIWLNGKTHTWLTTFTYDDNLKPPI